MNAPLCNGQSEIAHDFETLVRTPRGELGFMFPYLRVCTCCGVLEVILHYNEAVYFVPWSRPERTE